jgi:RNA polymerase sigma-70 factor, ECF subfamily
VPTPTSDLELVEALRGGDEAVFAEVVDAWSSSMLRLAASFVSTRASAEEVVQDTWLAVLNGIDGFQTRSSVRTWVYRILVNTAKKRGVRERRSIPWASLGLAHDDRGPTVDPARFQGSVGEYPGHWRNAPDDWSSPEKAALNTEFRTVITGVLEQLPERQRIVINLRDVEGHDADEVCQMLEISPANQRVLLHRARAVVREELADYLAVRTSGEGSGR